MTQKELAQKLGIKPRHLRRLAALGMPTDSVAAAKAWRAANIDGAPDGSDLNALRGDVLRKRARLLDLEFQERSRVVIPTEDVHRLLVQTAQAARARLLAATNLLRAAHPGLDASVYATLAKLHADVLALLSEDVLTDA